MSIATPVQAPLASVPGHADERLVMYNVPWTAYETQLALRGDNSVPRIAYLDGVMELMSPSRDHERLKSYLGRLVEAYALERDIDLSPYGAWTLRQAPRASGLEPDECYIIGADQRAERPHLAIEVVWTSGGLDKLEIYRRLEIPELWIWREGALHVFVLHDGAYPEADHSEQLPGIELTLLSSFLDRPTAMQAVRAYRAALQE
jgi:Uma2 family endonuclease